MNNYSAKTNFAILIFVCFAFAGIVISNINLNYYRENVESYPKYLSIINFYTEPVNITVEGQTRSMEFLDIENFYFTINDRIEIIVTNNNGEVIEKFRTLEFATRPHITIKLLNDRNEFCFFSGEVQEFYTDNENPEIKNLVIQSDEPSDELFRVFQKARFYVYPGKATRQDLGAEYINGKVIGLYPIECSRLKDEEARKNTVFFYKDYNPEVQRQNFQQKLQEIDALTL